MGCEVMSYLDALEHKLLSNKRTIFLPKCSLTELYAISLSLSTTNHSYLISIAPAESRSTPQCRTPPVHIDTYSSFYRSASQSPLTSTAAATCEMNAMRSVTQNARSRTRLEIRVNDQCFDFNFKLRWGVKHTDINKY
jgi:hypothetical protein